MKKSSPGFVPSPETASITWNFCQTIFNLVITDSPHAAAPQPFAIALPISMTIEQIIDHLQEQRERYGFTYFYIFAGQIDNFAPVVARLAGT